MKLKPDDEEMPWVVLGPLLAVVFLPLVESMYFGFIFSPRYHGGWMESLMPKWPWGHWECFWACQKSTPSIILNGAWLLSFLGLVALYFFPQLIKRSEDN